MRNYITFEKCVAYIDMYTLPDVAHAMLYIYEYLGNNKKFFEATVKVAYVLYLCLLYSETHRVFNFSSMQCWMKATTCELKVLSMLHM